VSNVASISARSASTSSRAGETKSGDGFTRRPTPALRLYERAAFRVIGTGKVLTMTRDLASVEQER